MNDLISRQAAIDALAMGEELLKRALDQMYVVGNDREKYEWGLGLIESYISDMKDLPSAQPEDWVERNKERILQAGMKGQEVEFRIGGRLFAIREKAQ